MDNDLDDIPEIGTDDVIETFEEDIENENEQEVTSFEEIIKEQKKKKTVPFLNKFEKARLLGVRRQQLANGAQSKIDTSGFDSIDQIVNEELRQRKIPLIIRRKLPNGVYEDWKLEEFMKI